MVISVAVTVISVIAAAAVMVIIVMAIILNNAWLNRHPRFAQEV
jgi:hypothetical protein